MSIYFLILANNLYLIYFTCNFEIFSNNSRVFYIEIILTIKITLNYSLVSFLQDSFPFKYIIFKKTFILQVRSFLPGIGP